MADLTVSADVDTFMASADKAAMVANLGALTPQLPWWTYSSGSIGSGLFTTNNSAPASTTDIQLFGGTLFSNIPVFSFLIITGPSGDSYLYAITDKILNAGNTEFTLSYQTPNLSGTPTNWNGVYTVSFAPPYNIDATKIADGSVTNTEFQYINSLSGNAQDQIDGKAGVADITMAAIQSAAGITPAMDFTYSLPTSITIKDGIITAIS